MNFPTYKYETKKQSEGFTLVAGCDEVGIGPLAGPVVAATVIINPESLTESLDKNKWLRVRDSKTISESEREKLFHFIKENCFDFGIGIVSHETIDQINIHQAALLAMKKSVEALKRIPDFLFLDGIHTIQSLDVAQECVIAGDQKILSISAASIIAKFTRDEILKNLHKIFPQYGFDKHKGYPTKFHREAIVKFGASPVHRMSFNLVQSTTK